MTLQRPILSCALQGACADVVDRRLCPNLLVRCKLRPATRIKATTQSPICFADRNRRWWALVAEFCPTEGHVLLIGVAQILLQFHCQREKVKVEGVLAPRICNAGRALDFLEWLHQPLLGTSCIATLAGLLLAIHHWYRLGGCNLSCNLKHDWRPRGCTGSRPRAEFCKGEERGAGRQGKSGCEQGGNWRR